MTLACAAGGAGERLVAWKHSLRRGRPRERKAQRHDTESSLCFQSSPGTPFALDETARDRDKARRSSSRRTRFTYSPVSRLRQSDASSSPSLPLSLSPCNCSLPLSFLCVLLGGTFSSRSHCVLFAIVNRESESESVRSFYEYPQPRAS